jgi:hypothetical protein
VAAVSSPQCRTNVTIGRTNSFLPSAGVSNAPALFVATAMIGVVTYEFWLRHHITDSP